MDHIDNPDRQNRTRLRSQGLRLRLQRFQATPRQDAGALPPMLLVLLLVLPMATPIGQRALVRGRNSWCLGSSERGRQRDQSRGVCVQLVCWDLDFLRGLVC